MPVDPTQLPLDDGDGIERLARRFHPLWVEAAYDDAALLLGGDVGGVDLAFDLDMPEVQQVLDQLGLLVRRVAQTTRDEIAALVGKQAENGWSMAQLADEIEKLGEIRSAERAAVIAATESALAYSRGSLLAYEQSGVVRGSEWLVTEPCEICAPLAGKVVELGGEFAEGVISPPAHPLCRCALSPVLKERG